MIYRVAVYGGSFSPTTNTHLGVLKYVADTGEFDKIIMVPSISHALKTTSFPYEHRVNMATLAVKHAKLGVRVDVSMVELSMLLHQAGPIYTIQLLRWLQAASPENEEMRFRFIVGPDIIEDLDQWKYVDEIRTEFGFLGVPDLGVHASEIREIMADGFPGWKEHVCAPVVEYIEMHGLYGVERVPGKDTA